MLSPLGQVPQRRPPRRRRHRRAWPLVLFILVFAVAAGAVWWRIFEQDANSAAKAAACASARPTAPVNLDPHTIEVRVYNATSRSGIAGVASVGLRQRGFDVVATANDPTHRTVTGIAEVRYGSAGAAGAQLVAAAVPGATLVSDRRSDAAVDVALGPKYHSLATPAAIREALRRLRTPSSPSPGCSSRSTAAPARSVRRNVRRQTVINWEAR